MIPAIRITTDRLVLRPPVEEDFPLVSDFMRSPRSIHIGGPVDDEFAAWRGFLGMLGHWALRGYGMFIVEHDNRPVGRVGVIHHIMWEEPELGWHLFDACEGYGYATEAARAARDWAWAERGLGPLVSYIVQANAASIRVAQRLGAHLERDGTLLGQPVQVWRHPAGSGGAAAERAS